MKGVSLTKDVFRMIKKFSCGHAGKGGFCHRCQQAEALEKAENSTQFKTSAERKAEAERLREVPKKNSYSPASMGS